MHRMRVALLSCLLVLGCLATPALAASTTTVQRTIQDCDGDNLLDYTFGEEHVPFSDPFEGTDEDCSREAGEGEDLRLPPSASVINFMHLTDFQAVDEESPGRVEFLDGTQRFPGLQPFSAAYRPQESLSTQVTEAMVRQVRNTRSPVTAAELDLTILTGDNADSQQFNETRWFIDILDGTTGTANPDPEMDAPDQKGRDRKIDPNSGIPGPDPNFKDDEDAPIQCEATPGSVYDGVRDSGASGFPADMGYYEPDSSSGERDDGDGYSPVREENEGEVGRDVTVRDFPGLFESANEPFEALGLDMPWYSAFGNHDALVQGNSPDAYKGPAGPAATEVFDPIYHAIATGCVKVKQPANMAAIRALVEAAGANPTPANIAAALAAAQQALVDADGTTDIVPPDPRRCYVAKDDPSVAAPDSPCETGSWIHQHFRTTGTPVGHGFAPSLAAACGNYGTEAGACRQAAEALGPDESLGRPPQAIGAHDGYYSFVPKPGLRFVVLDTITDECGSIFCSEGSVDDEQFQWLRQQILAAQGAGQYVLVFSHHTLRTTRMSSVDEAAGTHYGERQDRRGGQPQPQNQNETLEELYCKHPNVLAHIDGHEHENYVERHDCADDVPSTRGDNPHFWQISTAAHIDFPQQARMIELVKLGKKMSFVLTILDHDGTANPGGAPEQADQGHAPDDVQRLASIGRELAYNDYQGSRGARGGRQDRNVILPTDRPPPPYTPPTP